MITIEAEFDLAWSRFQSLDSLLLMPAPLESSWLGGREYAAFLVRINDPAAVDYLRCLAGPISSVPGVDCYPEPYWHMTVKGLGFVVRNPSGPGEISTAGLREVARAARHVFADQPAFDARLGRLNAFPEVVFVEVLDGSRVRELNTRLLDHLPQIVRYPFDGPRFLPHISIARFTSNDGLGELRGLLSRLRRERPQGPSLAIGRIDLVTARLSAEAPAFSTVASYTLRRQA